jgi:hypothetical protein
MNDGNSAARELCVTSESEAHPHLRSVSKIANHAASDVLLEPRHNTDENRFDPNLKEPFENNHGRT